MALDREALLRAFDDLGAAALARSEKLELAVYGGSALLLASNFRYATEDVDVEDATVDRPDWLRVELEAIARRNGWADDWLNDAVSVHLSPEASRSTDHVPFGSFPRGIGPYGLDVLVPTPEYMLALKLKAMRVLDPVKGAQEAGDIANLMRVAGVSSPDDAVAILGRYFPRSASSPEKQLFLLKRLQSFAEPIDAPVYPLRSDGSPPARNTDGDGDR